MAIIEILRTPQRKYDGNVEIHSNIFQLPSDKQGLKIGLRIHPDDYENTSLGIRFIVQVRENSAWVTKAKVEHLLGPTTNKHGVVNPNPFIRFMCGDMNNKDIRIGARSNGARFRLVAGGITQQDWDGDDDKGDVD